MKDVVLIELANKWDREGKQPDVISGDPAHAEMNGIFEGRRQAFRECAGELRALVKILGEKD